MRKILYIVNPSAGSGRSLKALSLIEERMLESKILYEVKITKEPLEATKIVEEMLETYEDIVAVGGDGTVNEVAKGMIRRKKGRLGIIPCGTGNDLARTIGIDINIQKALDIIVEGNTKTIDVGKVNGEYFLNVSSIGFDMEVAYHTKVIKKKVKSKIAYLLGIFITLLSYKRYPAEIEIDDKLIKKNLVLLAVGNGKFYGGGMKILPDAIADDGYFSICLVKDVSNIKILFLFPSIFKGNHLRYTKYVETYKANKIVYKNEGEAKLNIDGEIVQVFGDIVFEVDNYKQKVIF